tara:strand:+ start:580 stop:867 length:288 start_codon:yes stop_codon:yes gene_type:complete
MPVNKNFLPQTTDFKNQQNLLFKGLVKFFYENQYDDKYPTFRCCDLNKEEGDLIYTFYNITGGYNYIYEDPDSPFNDALLQMEIDMQRGGEYAYH